jgi:hypothetical protein
VSDSVQDVRLRGAMYAIVCTLQSALQVRLGPAIHSLCAASSRCMSGGTLVRATSEFPACVHGVGCDTV